jgi:hypothetical protein
MTRTILGHSKDGHHTATVSRSVTIGASQATVWKEIGNIAGLADWVVDVKKVEYLSGIKQGIGASREILFADGGKVVEYVVGWKSGKYLSYIATSGLPLDGYHATLSVLPKGRGVQVTWTSFLISCGSDKKQFEEFLEFIESFYERSLDNLKTNLEK